RTIRTFGAPSGGNSGSIGGYDVSGSLASWVGGRGAGGSGIGSIVRAWRSGVMTVFLPQWSSGTSQPASAHRRAHHADGVNVIEPVPTTPCRGIRHWVPAGPSPLRPRPTGRTVVCMGSVVETVHGAVRGNVAGGVHVFLGVPYAAPPFGANRLQPPRPVEPWKGVRDTTELGPEPPQVAPPRTGGSQSGAAEVWEDIDEAFAKVERATPIEECLNLNIWTPDPEATGLPVMVWIQGGMFELSSTASYDGSRFARDGVLCVVINW